MEMHFSIGNSMCKVAMQSKWESSCQMAIQCANNNAIRNSVTIILNNILNEHLSYCISYFIKGFFDSLFKWKCTLSNGNSMWGSEGGVRDRGWLNSQNTQINT